MRRDMYIKVCTFRIERPEMVLKVEIIHILKDVNGNSPLSRWKEGMCPNRGKIWCVVYYSMKDEGERNDWRKTKSLN